MIKHITRWGGLSLALLGTASGTTVFASEFDEYLQEETTYTPMQIKQGIRDVAGPLTVLTREYLEKVGVTSIAQAMRLVPGMNYRQRGSQVAIAYHSTNEVIRWKMNVQIDGQTIFAPALTTIPWTTFPISFNDVDRIEVLRSPAAASFGSNSFQAVVNIITKDPEASKDEVTTYIRSDDSGEAYFNKQISLGKTKANVSVSHEEDGGHDIRILNGVESKNTAVSKSSRLNIKSTTSLSDTEKLNVVLRLSDTFRDTDFIPGNRNANTQSIVDEPNLETRDIYSSASYIKEMGKHQFEVNLSYLNSKSERAWYSCGPLLALTPEFSRLLVVNIDLAEALITGRPVVPQTAEELAAIQALQLVAIQAGSQALSRACGDTDLNYREARKKIELVDRYQLKDDLRIISKLSFSREDASSGTHFRRESPFYEVISGSVNVEYLLNNNVTFNAGGYVEDNNYSDANYAYRLYGNYHIDEYQSLRIGGNVSFREPNLYEQFANNVFPLRNISTNVLGITSFDSDFGASASGNMKEEKITAYEIGHYLNYKNILKADTKLFYEQLSNLNAGFMGFLNFNPNNEGEATLKGIEAEVGYWLTPAQHLKTSFSYIDQEVNRATEKSFYSRWIGSLAYFIDLNAENTLGLVYTGSSNDDGTPSQNEYRASYTYKRNLSSGTFDVQAIVSYRPNTETQYIVFPPFGEDGWREGRLHTIKDSDKAELTLRASYKW